MFEDAKVRVLACALFVFGFFTFFSPFALAQGTTDPTEKNRLATATPASFASGSTATIENVAGSGGAAKTPATGARDRRRQGSTAPAMARLARCFAVGFISSLPLQTVDSAWRW